MSTSGQKMKGSLLPSPRVTRLSAAASAAIIRFPAAIELVKFVIATQNLEYSRRGDTRSNIAEFECDLGSEWERA